ncbi:MAG TPA: peptide ABC transporter substrate-binding protein [Thermomicrobiales bacterium]|nr:peptide ABC transporter substrate-binding protein [Thermomicrobiales bacterium]
MSQQIQTGPFSGLFASLKRGEITRRQFIERSTALGMGLGVAMYCAGTVGAQDASPEASPAAAAKLPDGGTEGQERGAGGELKIIQWQAPTQANSLVSTGDKDNLASQLVSEALMVRDPEGHLIPVLVTDVPTVENGLLAEDLKSVTFKLKEGIVWNDGEPLTAEDVRFTWEWAMDDANAVVQQSIYARISDVEVVDDLTAKLVFAEPNPTWADAFTGSGSSVVLPKHVLEGADQAKLDEFRINPVGTGPYKIESFSVNDQVTYVINDTYREPNKPFFSRVTLKGGGDAAAAARATLQTGEYDFGWNLTIEKNELDSLQGENNPGEFHIVGGLNIERININFSDPDTEVDGQRSEMNTPHPILSDHAVRQALTIGINREQISNELYFGMESEPAIQNILSGIPSMESPNTELVYDPEQAAKLLDEAGWVLDGSVRKKDGKELKLRLYTTTSAIRQKTQAIAKANLEQIGFKIELQQADAAVFFDSSPGNDQSNTHFYTDLNMFTSTVAAPPPITYMIRWYAGKDRQEIAQKSNGWAGRNFQRYVNPDYDAAFDKAAVEPDPEKSAELFIQMNDILYNDYAVIPLIRQGKKAGISKRLRLENVALNSFEFDYYNIANWNLAEGAQ